MGQLLMRYYKYANDEAGLACKFALAKATKIPSIQAAMLADSPENVKLFREALQSITGKPAPEPKALEGA
jgi:hypothetical protein